MNKSKRVISDIANAIEHFPKLKSRWENKHELWIVEGDLDICDAKGVYWDTFDIAIGLDKAYPYSVPVVIERGRKIPREQDRHISESGVCCVDIEHRLLFLAQKGIVLSDFISEKVYPFFANQLYFEEEKQYAGDEYLHRFAGVRQFYNEELQIKDCSVAITIIEAILTNKLPGRNKLCPCQSNQKFKKCHLQSVDFLGQVGREQLRKDLEGFRNNLTN